jgi:tRNA U34 5-methylaminomethyl-2-thiouridine-forming methyltransferase MnmC
VTDQSVDLDWVGKVPVSRRFADPYYSLEDGLAEARHVFLGGNDLPARFCPGFAIAEFGFGTGLNILAAWDAWRAADVGGALVVTSFEAFPLSAEEMAASLAAFPEIDGLARPLVAAWREGRRDIRLDGLELTVIEGDARQTLLQWVGSADAWFLDGFAPARNPELWEPGLMAEVARHTRAGGTAATYSAAGEVRRSLAAAGFTVERRTGYGRKRHMTAARL